MNYSQSEDNGIAALKDDDLLVYSVGVSTGGVAEIRMAELNPRRHIIATTIDEKGVKDAQKFIAEKGFEKQIEVKLEDASKKLSYKDNYFDYIYARLVLHYLSKQELSGTLKELRRILNPGSKIFIVVRSISTHDAKNNLSYDPKSGLTSYKAATLDGKGRIDQRYFHSEDSIKEYLTEAGFKVNYVKSYDEMLFVDFMRTKTSPHPDNLVEVTATK